MTRIDSVLALFGLLAVSTAWAQGASSIPDADAMPLADYLSLLRQIAPAAEAGSRDYLALFKQRCGRDLSTSELRHAMAQGDGDPVLMGLIRASHLRDSAAREHLADQIRCPSRGRP